MAEPHTDQSVSTGDVFLQVNPAPGFDAESYQVLRPAEREGWWWCRPWLAPISEKRKPAHALLNSQLYRKLAPDERRRPTFSDATPREEQS
jgi:hypothetical protein